VATLIFDIETIGDDWSEFDDSTKSVLTRWIDRTAQSEDERSIQLQALQDRLGLSPLTGSIVSIAMYDLERSIGAVYFVSDDEDEFKDNNFLYKSRTEKMLLEDFWSSARSYDTFVTFNGRAFDVPFLLHRSVVCGVVPSIELGRRRYLSQQAMPYHVDLQDELTLYGAMYRRPPLHMFCRAYGIKSPKDTMDGYQVAEFFQSKKFRDLARYNAADVIATTKLYEIWKKHLAPRSWLNVVDY